MGTVSNIQWCDGTINPTMGCDGCELWQIESKPNARRSCYAGLDHERKKGTNKGFAPVFEQVTEFPGRTARAAKAKDLRGLPREGKPWLNGMPRLWFVSDMSDALSKSVSFKYLATEIVEVASSQNGSRHAWLWLTKQPKRMAEFSAYLGPGGWPKNVWAGTSITAQSYANRVDHLRKVGDEDTIRFLSVEPQHGEITLHGKLQGISWVIQGGESGRTKAPSPDVPDHPRKLRVFNGQVPREFDLAWARKLRDECRDADVPYFLKQLGSLPREAGHPLKLQDRHGGEWDEWPQDLRVREMPRWRS